MAETHPENSQLRTPLYQNHVGLRAKMVPFGGWIMPVSYEGVLAEHKTVRDACGLFDVSHMGEIRVSGPESEKFLQHITINDVSRLTDGAGQYSAILNESGGMIDDLIIYRLSSNEFFICVNASNTDKDFNWVKSCSKNFNVSVVNESSKWGQIAVQGPKSLELLKVAFPDQAATIEKLPYTNIARCSFLNAMSLIARTGYTGEWGYELYVPADNVSAVWEKLLACGKDLGVKPIGLGARDTLRLEACYLLYGNDMNDSATPLEAGIGWATKLEKGDFIGSSILKKQKASGVPRKIVAFKMLEDGIPRHGMQIRVNDRLVGEVTSGSVLPTIGGAGGMALVESALAEGSEMLIDVRGKPKRAMIVKRPLYAARVK